MKKTKTKKAAASRKGAKFYYVACSPAVHRKARSAARKKGVAMWKYVDEILQKAA